LATIAQQKARKFYLGDIVNQIAEIRLLLTLLEFCQSRNKDCVAKHFMPKSRRTIRSKQIKVETIRRNFTSI